MLQNLGLGAGCSDGADCTVDSHEGAGQGAQAKLPLVMRWDFACVSPASTPQLRPHSVASVWLVQVKGVGGGVKGGDLLGLQIQG